MKTNFSNVDKILFVSVSFTLALLAARIIYTHELTYMFYPWNLSWHCCHWLAAKG